MVVAMSSPMKPILFNTWSMERLLAGTKTQTRRLAKLDNPHQSHPDNWWYDPSVCNRLKARIAEGEFADTVQASYPAFEKGDVLWVRETFHLPIKLYAFPIYKADLPSVRFSEYRWTPSMFMPKEYCRMYLQITDVRDERLQSISEADAKAEGCQSVAEYMEVFCRIAGAEVTHTNPWVWVYEFKKITKETAYDLCSRKVERGVAK